MAGATHRLSVDVGGHRVKADLRELQRPPALGDEITATDADAIALAKLMDGVGVFEPDWADIDKNLTSYVEDWKSATGS
ncbi:hypothetical protein GCM10023335_07320 [Streptomyces siamensis]|uniref:Uncharacterized protein n=1 Tax=Streptomyces siamensis TaxID=1274986 RepID=A0ABP9IHE1_9ACTN